MNSKILLVDDDNNFLENIIHYLGNTFDYIKANKLSEGLKLVHEKPDIILLDVELENGVDGITAIPKYKEVFGDIPIVMLTRHNDLELAVQAIKNGADNYFIKSPDTDDLKKVINKILSNRYCPSELKYLRTEVASLKGEMIGDSTVMQELEEKINHASKLNCSVLITGETGTGKELVARKIHELGAKAAKPFVAVNISGISKDLFASELFGHKKGSFTGAISDKIGYFEIAGHGTLFLDEIGYIPKESQVKLLRILEDKKMYSVGSTNLVEAPARILSATNQDLVQMINDDEFREDLYYRLCPFRIEVPPLRERREDIFQLCNHFLSKYGKNIDLFDSGAKDLLLNHDWPGNVRQLKNLVEIIHSSSDSLVKSDLVLSFLNFKKVNNTDCITICDKELFESDFKTAKSKINEVFKNEYIEKLLFKTNGNMTKAAEISGMARNTLYRLKSD